MGKINFKTSTLSSQPTKEVEETMRNLVTELDAVIRKYGLDTYLLVVKSQGEESMYSTAICPLDSAKALGLVQEAAMSYNKLVFSEMPTGPGGVA